MSCLLRSRCASFLSFRLYGVRLAARCADDSCSFASCTIGSRWKAPALLPAPPALAGPAALLWPPLSIAPLFPSSGDAAPEDSGTGSAAGCGAAGQAASAPIRPLLSGTALPAPRGLCATSPTAPSTPTALVAWALCGCRDCCVVTAALHAVT